MKTDRTRVVTPTDPNPLVRELLESTAEGVYDRDDFNRQRGADVLEFFTGLLIEHKRAEYEAFKQNGKSARLSPLLLDTGEAYHIQSLYLHQHGDAVATCTYMTGLHHDPDHPRFPWNSGLEEPPKLAWDVPWAETHRVPGKPHFVYEVGIENPVKYRTEFPYRVVALAAIQDFDIVCWHVDTNRLEDSSDPDRYHQRMDYTHPASPHPDGLHYRYDEVLSAAIATAGQIFKSGLLATTPQPTEYIFGRNTLYEPDSMDYAKSYGDLGHTFAPTTYRFGSRMRVDPNRLEDAVIGPTRHRGVFETSPIQPTDEISFDWRRGQLRLDAPGAVSFSGFLIDSNDPITFMNANVEVSDVAVINPSTVAYPIDDDERYIAFGLVSLDGKPLTETNQALMSLVSTSFNTGFAMDHEQVRAEYLWQRNPGAIVSRGEGPAQVARVEATVHCSQLTGMRYEILDWRLDVIDSGLVQNGVVRISANQDVFLIRFYR